MSEEKVMITIEDVRIAFKVINMFLNQIDEFERLAGRLKRYSRRLDEKSMLMRMFMQQLGVKPQPIAEEGEEEKLTPEELERLKKVAEKYVK